MKSFFFFFSFLYIQYVNVTPQIHKHICLFHFSHEFLQCVTHDEICTLLLVEAANL